MSRWYAALILLLPVACAPQDPLDRPYSWKASMHANDANLRAMIADPADLTQGRSVDTALGAEAGPPIQRLLTGHRAELQGTTLLDVGVLGQQAPQAPGGNNGGQQ